MLKSILHIAVSLLLLLATTGYTITKHYCGSDLISVVLGTQAQSCCDGPCDYCHDETQYFQVEDDFVSVDITQVQIKIFAASFLQHTDLVEFENGIFFQLDTNPEYTSLKLPVPAKAQSRISVLQTFLL